MLRQLSIQNFAIIDQLLIEFHPQFNVITGETGAGKSILMGALGLVLGNRADSGVLFDAAQKCVVEARFDAANNKPVQACLRQMDLDEEDDLLLRREITSNGKSRAFINDTPVNLTQMRTLSALLVDLHQQFDTLELGSADRQRTLLDAWADTGQLLHPYQQLYKQFQQSQQALQHLEQQQQQAEQQQDYLQFQLNELLEAGFREQEIEQLEQEQQLLNNAGTISRTLTEAMQLFKENDGNLLQQLKYVLQRLRNFEAVVPAMGTIVQRLQASHIELTDLTAEMSHLQQQTLADPERLQQIEERLNTAYRLLKKHHVNDTAALLQLQQQWETQLHHYTANNDAITRLQQQVLQLRNQVQAAANELTKARKEAIPAFESNVIALLQQVGMPNARLLVQLDAQEPGAWGADRIEFLFHANVAPGTQPEQSAFAPISKVASGGELSRLMLCIQSLVAKKVALPTLIFDEIDTGISGEAARQTGLLMQELASRHQIIAITHLPQIAARGTAHFLVAKAQVGKAMHTRVQLLSNEEKVETIARMLGGTHITNTTLAAARELIETK